MKFEVTAPDGRTLEIEGDSFPSESELDEIFASVKPDIDYNKAKVNDIFSTDGLPSDTPSKLQGLGTFLKEGVGKPFVQGYFQQAKGIGGIMNWYADQSRLSKESAEALGISEETRKKLNTFSDILNIAGDSVRFGAEEMIEKDWLKSDPEIFKGGFLENPSWTRTSAAVASALPSIGSIVAFGKNNFALGYALLAGSENADIYLEAKEKVGEEKASGLFLAGTAGTAAIDIAMQPIEKIIKPLTGSFIKRMGERVVRGGMEALPESMQQVLQNAVKKYGYDATQDLAEGVIESAIGGFGVGAIAAGSGKLLEQGATEEEVEQLQNIMTQAIIEDSEAINDIAYQDMKKTLNKINAKYANMPESERMRISRELEEGFGKYYEELSKIMPKEQAVSNAALIRNQAFFMSDLMGVSPKEYFDKYAPKIEKMKFDEFGIQKAQFEFGGVNAKTAALDKLSKAEQLEAKGVDNEAIRQQTGWFKGADGMWRFEISDKDAKFKDISKMNFKKQVDVNGDTIYTIKLDELLEHEKLYEAYPELRNVEVISLEENQVKDKYTYGYAQAGKIVLYSKNLRNQKNGIKTLMHEIQHLIQDKEGFARGGTESEAKQIREDIKRTAEKKMREYVRNKLDELVGRDLSSEIMTEYKIYIEMNRDSLNSALNYGESDARTQKLNEQAKEAREDFEKSLKKAGISREEFNKITIEARNLEDLGKVLKIQNLSDYEVYESLAGEIEARNTETRMEMTEEERKTKSPEETQDIKNADAIVVFDDGTAFSYKSNINYQERQGNIYGATNSNEEPIANPANFNKFIEGSKVTDNDEPVSPENPPKKIYRGDTRYFEEYETQDNAYEYDWGKGFYLSDDYEDVAENYQSRGADLTNRIDREAEQLAQDEDIDYDEAREKVRQQYEQEDIIREFYLSIKEPVIIGGEKETFFDYTEQYNEETDEYEEPQGKLLDLIYGIENYLADIGADEYTQAITGRLYEAATENGGLSASQIEDIVRGTEEANYLIDYESGPGEMLSSVFGTIGFDGIIDHRAGTKFKNMNMNPDTTHYIVFNSEQAKSVDNNGQWGTENKNFYYQGEQSPQGAYANDTIYLFENADESTLPHELSHRWDKELRSIAEETGNERVKAMLEQVDTWEESEFKRKFNVVKRENGYAVVNKKDDVVYDDRGRGFLTEQDAKNYGKKELFARGFEQYLREGKAPNNSLKQAFRNFFMWLKKIYRDAMDLNIQLSPDIKNVYADILGGTDIDFFLESTPESFIQQRIKLGQDKETAIDGIIQDAIANKKQIVKNKGGKGFSEVWAKAMIPLSTRAKRISPKLRNVLRKYEFTLSNELNKKYAKVTPFMNIWKGMSEDDAIAFDFALKNDYVKKQLEIVDKYNARKEWEAVRETLEQIYDEAINAGLDINWRPDYFPRKVKDVDGFLSYIHNMPEWTRFQQAIDEAGLSGATAEEQAEFLNKYLRGFVKVDLMPNKYGSEKQRTIDIIDNEMNKFYTPSIEALVGYIEGLNSRVVSANFLGKGANIEESIGGYLTYLLNNNIIAPNQIDEVRTILRARFDAKGVSNRWLANARNYSYMYTMGGLNSAITQIEDLSVAMYKAGVWNTLTTAMQAKRITKQDLGLTSISAEFVEQSKSGELLNKLFKLTGLDAIDGLGKETLVNAELKKFQKMSDETLREYLEPIMENETEATIKDIKNDVISDNVLYLMFSELSDVQPVSLSELPEFYNRGGNLRVLYMLKSFAVKRIDTFRNECIDKIKSKDLNVRKEGLQNMFKLASLMILCGATKDWLIDLLYGRDTDISERLLNNILGLVGISKFQIYQAKEKGFTGTVKDLVVPPLFSFFDDLFTDTVKVAEGKREIKDMEVLKGIPLVGRFYYWWVGRGREKSKGKKKKY